MRSLSERLSRAIVRLHPRTWRERYSEEMLALIEDSGSSWAHVFDLAAGCADEWFRALLRSEDFLAMLGAVLVRVLTETAKFSWTPPAYVSAALQWAFLILALIILLVFTFVGLFLLFRLAWRQRFSLLRGGRLEPVQQSIGWTPSPRLVRAFKVSIMIFAVGAGLTPPRLYTSLHLPDYLSFRQVVMMMTFFTLKCVPLSLVMIHFLTSRPWRAKRDAIL